MEDPDRLEDCVALWGIKDHFQQFIEKSTLKKELLNTKVLRGHEDLCNIQEEIVISNGAIFFLRLGIHIAD